MNKVINVLDLILTDENHVVNDLISEPLGDVMSHEHYDLDLALKSPSMIVKDRLKFLI